eukprot:1250130-Pyramimonas_sp.AAC.1
MLLAAPVFANIRIIRASFSQPSHQSGSLRCVAHRWSSPPPREGRGRSGLDVRALTRRREGAMHAG